MNKKEDLFSEDALRRLERVNAGQPVADAASLAGPGTTKADWLDAVEERFRREDGKPLEIAERAANKHPTDPDILLYTAFAAVREQKPDVALRYLKRLEKWYTATPNADLCRAIALAQMGRWPLAQGCLLKIENAYRWTYNLLPPGIPFRWGESWKRQIRRWSPQSVDHRKASPKQARIHRQALAPAPPAPLAPAPVAQPQPEVKPLARFLARVPVNYVMPGKESFDVLRRTDSDTLGEFLLRGGIERIFLLKGFDELLCLSHLHGVEYYWYQVETVRKVLKQFRGRVLLADEVGLGKTIEAGMTLKEYMLRGMVGRVLILTPPSLVGQWQEEMETKFGVAFITTHDSLLRRDPVEFWGRDRIIASIATARLARHMDLVCANTFDMLIVDEAHHLKNRTSRNWKLLEAVKKRFLLLLTATPVQNNLLELYNLLTLLKPGLFSTEKEFRATYVTPGHPRVPLNKERLQALVRDSMVRNTRSLVDVHLPPRHALTLRPAAGAEEQACYEDLSRLIRKMNTEEQTVHRLALHHLLQAAGSSPRAVTTSLDRFMKHSPPIEWSALRDRYAALNHSAKQEALIELLGRNPEEKKIVFVRYLETLETICDALAEKGLSVSRFDGHMSGPEKDRTIEQFREHSKVLVCTESGGEGRNLQFCNTLVNFDLPWNPQTIEQRIGRVHRIGQEREVFVFNLAVKDTVEDRILRILDEKINMFELVVGEVQSILGELDEERDFADLVFSAWIAETDGHREEAFDKIGEQLLRAKSEYDRTKAYDEDLFGEELEVV